MSFGNVGFHIRLDAHRPCPASLPIRVPADAPSLPLLPTSPRGYALRGATVHVTIPINSFQLTRLRPCRAHKRWQATTRQRNPLVAGPVSPEHATKTTLLIVRLVRLAPIPLLTRVARSAGGCCAGMPCRLRCAARRGKAATTRTGPRGALRRPATASVSALKEQNTRPPISEGNHARLPQTLISSFHWRWHAHALSLGSSSSQEANPTKKAAGVSTGGHWKATPYSRL
jgi:hypothetical protein